MGPGDGFVVPAHVRRRIDELRAELRGSWGKPTSWVKEREDEIANLLRIYAGPQPAPEDV